MTTCVKDAIKFRAVLQKHGIRPQWTVTQGNHAWQVWRKHPRNFAPPVFRQDDFTGNPIGRSISLPDPQ